MPQTKWALVMLAVVLHLACAEHVQGQKHFGRGGHVHLFADAPAPKVSLPSGARRVGGSCNIADGCIPAASIISDHAEADLGHATAQKTASIQMADHANHISLSASPCFHITCPNFTYGATNATVEIAFTRAMPKSMFEGNPFISAGMEFGCIDASGEVAPLYSKVIGGVVWQHPLFVSVQLKPANISDIFTGTAGFTVDPVNETEAKRRADSRRNSDPSISTTPVPMEGPSGACVNAAMCESISSVSAGMLTGNECPIGYPDFNILSLSRAWDSSKNAPTGTLVKHRRRRALSFGTTAITAENNGGTAMEASDSTCTGTQCMCESGKYRYHCCKLGETGMHYSKTIDIFKFNANYDETTKRAASEKTFGTLFTCKNCYAFMGLKAVFNLEVGAAPMTVAKILVPNSVKKFEAYLQGDVDMSLDFSIQSGDVQKTLGPYTIKEKTKVTSYTAVIGYIPVKVTFYFELKVQMDFAATLKLPAPLIGGGKLKGTAKYGGTYFGTNDSFVPIQEKTMETPTLTLPSPSKLLLESELNGTVKLIAIPVLYADFYDMMPLSLEFRPYVGVDFTKYPVGNTPNRKCPGTNIDLFYQAFYGLEFAFRITRPKTPSSLQIEGMNQGIFGGIALACRTTIDAVKVYGVTIIPGGTTQLKTYPSGCPAASADSVVPGGFCTCLTDSNFGTDTYLVRWPSQTFFTILPKSELSASVCTWCSGCLAAILEYFTSNFVLSVSSTDFGLVVDPTNKFQQAFITTVANMSGVAESAITITSITAASRRSSSVNVAYQVAGSSDEMTKCSTSLGSSNANSFATAYSSAATTSTGATVTTTATVTVKPTTSTAGTQPPPGTPGSSVPADSGSSGGSNAGVIAGAVIGTLACLGGAGAIAAFVIHKRRQSEANPPGEGTNQDGVTTAGVELGISPSAEPAAPTADSAPPPGASYQKNGVWMDEKGEPIITTGPVETPPPPPPPPPAVAVSTVPNGPTQV